MRTIHQLCSVLRQQAELERILEGERRQLPWQHISALAALTLGEALGISSSCDVTPFGRLPFLHRFASCALAQALCVIPAPEPVLAC